MTTEDFVSLLQALVSDWTNRDYERVAAKFAEDVFYSDQRNYTFADRESLLRFFQDDDGKPQRCEFHNAVFDEERQLGAAEYTYEGTFRYHGTVWIELKENRIASWREYQHRSDKDWKEFWNQYAK